MSLGQPPRLGRSAISAEESNRTADAAQRRLQGSIDPRLHDVRCVTRNGSVVLRGRVPSFYLKQLAQEAVRTSDGKCEIINEIEVIDN